MKDSRGGGNVIKKTEPLSLLESQRPAGTLNF